MQEVSDYEGLRESLAAKGYDLVDQDGSDSDEGLPGRIPSLEPGLAREKGKQAFEKGKYDRAIKYWQGGLKNILSSLCAGPHALQDENLSEMDLTLNLNIAMAYMKKEDFDMADRSVDKALARREALPPNLVTKALYRKASAQRAMHRLDDCLGTLKDLLDVEPGNSAALQMQREVDREWAKQCRQQKKNFAKLFDKMSGEDKVAQENLRTERAKARSDCVVCWIAGEDVNSEAFESGDVPACTGEDWGMAFSRTVLWGMEQFAVENAFSLPRESASASIWFVGASSTCDLRQLQPSAIMSRLPGIQLVELALIGFLGELTPDNKREPDPKADSLPTGLKQTTLPDGRHMRLRIIKGTLKEALEKDLRPAATSSDAQPIAEDQVAGESEATIAATDAGAAASSSGSQTETAVAAPAADEEPPPLPEAGPATQVPPTFAVIAHPQLHRYFSDFFPAIAWLIQQKVPTMIIGASEPDPSWKQDEVLLRALGCDIVVSKRESPYPMCLQDNLAVKKCNHVIGFLGGKAIEREKLVKTKLDLLGQDYTVR